MILIVFIAANKVNENLITGVERMNMNIKDIAKISGVGIATVSRVINNTEWSAKPREQR
jgi:transposase